MPTRADGAARSEFERAVRYGTLRAPPTTTPPKLTEATLGLEEKENIIQSTDRLLVLIDEEEAPKRTFTYRT